MNDIVKNVKTKIKFTFNNGETYELPLVGVKNTDLTTYGTSISIKEKLYEPDSNNLIGNISCNSMSIELVSKDKLLISSNKNSKYYGMMNNTAIVDVYCTAVDDDNNEIYMGRYFVDSWENGTSNSNIYEVSISCVDLLNKIKNISLTDVELKRNITFKEYMITIIKKLNKQLPDSMKIKYNEEDLDIFNSSTHDWTMYYNNIDRDNIEAVFNAISKASISYLWINRAGYFKTDCLLDDNESEAVSSISGLTNLLSYEVQNGDIYNYSGLIVKYISSMSYEDCEVLNLDKFQLCAGINTIETTLNSNKVINIHNIEIRINDNPTESAKCISFQYYKNNIKMNIVSTVGTTDASIIIYGTKVNETYNNLTKYKDENNTSSTLEVENYILRKEDIETYTDGMLQLMSMENGMIVATGFINPAIELDNIVMIIGKSLEIEGYYKVIGLEYTLGTNYRCKITLIKTINTVPNIDSICYDDNIAVTNMINGTSIRDYTFEEKTGKNNDVVYNELGDEIDALAEYTEEENE